MMDNTGITETEQVLLHFECDDTPDIDWVVESGHFSEKLNEPYELVLTLATGHMEAVPTDLLGRHARFSMHRGHSLRQISGIVAEVQEGSTHPQRITTNIVVAPAFAALDHQVDTRIFQEKPVPEILLLVLGEGLAPFQRTLELRLGRTYPTCEYRTQYSESNRAFCERLMEEEGIVYWFEFNEDAEKLVISDDPGSFEQIQSFHESFPSGVLTYSEYEGHVGEHEYVSKFHAASQLRPTKVATRHFDWTHPSMPFVSDSTVRETTKVERRDGARVEPTREVYEHDDRPLTFHRYDGLAFGSNDMPEQTRLRREAQAWPSFTTEGETTALGMTAARTFDLLGHPQGDLDGEYLVLAVVHSFDESGVRYHNEVRCLPSSIPFRPERLTTRPRIHSVQTATVVGPAGEEIHTDEHGRIKVQPHWDRQGRLDEHSSCWIRVMQPWAGTGWGFVFIPRIGMEVMVSFVNGDPDSPVVVGSLYNGDHPPPYPLPGSKTRSVIRTNSSLGGSGFNELSFEDKKGEEEVYVHAEKDFDEVVEHDHNTLVHNDQTNRVDANQTENVHVDQRLTVDRNRFKTILGNETTAVLGTRNEEVTLDKTVTLLANRNFAIRVDDKVVIDGHKRVEIGKTRKEEVGTKSKLTAGESIVLETGESSMTLLKDGTIVLKGVKLVLKGSELIEMKSALITEN